MVITELIIIAEFLKNVQVFQGIFTTFSRIFSLIVIALDEKGRAKNGLQAVTISGYYFAQHVTEVDVQ